MKIIFRVLLTIGIGSTLISAVPVDMESQPQQMVKFGYTNAQQEANFSGAIQIIPPQMNLETAVRNAEQGDVLLMGPEGWYRIEGKTLQQGTKMYILGKEGSNVAAFPKEAENSLGR
jgi:hypothetical protein